MYPDVHRGGPFVLRGSIRARYCSLRAWLDLISIRTSALLAVCFFSQ